MGRRSLFAEPPTVLTVTVSRLACGGCVVDRSGPGSWHMEPPPRYCPVSRHHTRCPTCGVTDDLVLTHALGDPHITAKCPSAHTWAIRDFGPDEFRNHWRPTEERHRAPMRRLLL